jgi:hypothetical protein
LEKIKLVQIDLGGKLVRLGKFEYYGKMKVLPHVFEAIMRKIAEPPKNRTPKLPQHHRLVKAGVY